MCRAIFLRTNFIEEVRRRPGEKVEERRAGNY